MSKLVFNLCLVLTLSLWQPEMLLIANAQKRAPGKQDKRNQKIDYSQRVRCELLPGTKEAWKPPKNTSVYSRNLFANPIPQYPPEAKAARVTGTVIVKLTIDKSGRVITAHAVGGSPLLWQASAEAACHSRFDPNPNLEEGAEESKKITYTFVLQLK